jgi:hypothetical protein
VEHLIKWMLRLFCLLPLRGLLRLHWLVHGDLPQGEPAEAGTALS